MTFTNILHVKPNNPKMGDKFNPAMPESSLVPFDANNLYGDQLSRKLPKDGFEYLSEKDLQTFDITKVDPKQIFSSSRYRISSLDPWWDGISSVSTWIDNHWGGDAHFSHEGPVLTD